MPEWIAWAPAGREALGAAIAVKGQQLNRDLYPLLLRKRLQWLVEEADATDLREVSDLLLEAGLMVVPLERETAAKQITESEEVMAHLASLGIPGKAMPPVLMSSNPAAEEAFVDHSLVQWTHLLVSGLIDRS